MAGVSPENLLLRRPLPAAKCTLGCTILDRCLGGGVPCKSITEVVAESGSGKTQLCLQLALSAQLPLSLGGLAASTLFLHTEFPFPLRRLRQLCGHFRAQYSISESEFDPLDNVFVRAVHSTDQLLDEMPKIEFLLSERKLGFPVRLIVIDSIAALFRSEFDNTPFDLKRRSSLFFKISGKLRLLAERFDLTVVVTNQVVDFFGENGGMNGLRIGNLRYLYSLGRRVCPALGLAWANCVNTRLFLSRNEEVVGDENGTMNVGHGDILCGQTRRQLHVLFAPHLPESSTDFLIRSEGVFGVDK